MTEKSTIDDDDDYNDNMIKMMVILMIMMTEKPTNPERKHVFHSDVFP